MASSALFSDQDIQAAGGTSTPTAQSASDQLFSDSDIAQAAPAPTGQVTNDVGVPVIVPKKGESFSDTVQRAIARQKALTADQRQDEINRELHTMPAKAAETLGAAATIGLAGPTTLATAGAGLETLPQVIPHTIEGVKAITAWASKNPLAAYALYNIVRELVPGAKKAIGLIHAAPGGE